MKETDGESDEEQDHQERERNGTEELCQAKLPWSSQGKDCDQKVDDNILPNLIGK